MEAVFVWVLCLLSVWTITGTWSIDIQQRGIVVKSPQMRGLVDKSTNDSVSSVNLETKGEADLKKGLFLDGSKKAQMHNKTAHANFQKMVAQDEEEGTGGLNLLLLFLNGTAFENFLETPFWERWLLRTP